MPLSSKNREVPGFQSDYLSQDESETLTGVALPVKVVIGVAVATEIQTSLLVSWAVGKGDVIVSNILEEVELILLKEKTSSNRVHGSITPSLVEETTVLVQRLKEVKVRLAAEPRQAANFKVGPLNTVSYELIQS
jgi:hypothetical protein